MGWSYGSIRRNDATGVTFSRGGKNNRTTFEVDVSEILAWAQSNAASMAEFTVKAAGRAASALRGQLRKIMTSEGGLYGVPKFTAWEDFTRQLREKNGGGSDKIGGQLAEHPEWIVMWKEGGKQFIGWPNARKSGGGKLTKRVGTLDELAYKFQLGGTPDEDVCFTDPGWRKHWQIRGFWPVPDTYVHNRRDVMSTFQDHIAANLAEWREGALRKMVAQQLAQKSGWAKFKERKSA